MGQVKAYIGNPAVQIGLLAGVVGSFLSFLTRGWLSYRYLADPLPLIQALPTLLRTQLYFNWQLSLAHLLFLLLLVILNLILLYWRLGRLPLAAEARLAAQISVGLNVILITLIQADAAVVAMWYGLGSLLSIWLAAIFAQNLAKFLLFPAKMRK